MPETTNTTLEIQTTAILCYEESDAKELAIAAFTGWA